MATGSASRKKPRNDEGRAYLVGVRTQRVVSRMYAKLGVETTLPVDYPTN